MIYNIILIFTANIALGRRALLVSNEIRLYPNGNFIYAVQQNSVTYT